MKFRILKTTIVSAFLLVSGLAEAALISHNNYSLNTDTNIVTNNGTEWLQWDVTIGESMSSALGKYASEGWMLASNYQMAALFTDFGWGSSVQEDGNIITRGTFSASTDESSMDKFIELFGSTRVEEPNPRSRCRENGAGGLGCSTSASIYGSDLDNDGLYKSAYIYSDYVYCRDECYNYEDTAHILHDYYANASYSNSGVGIALVRVVEVPAPSTVLIFALGLMGLAARRFKKQA
jgi:hypothetical protein